MTSPFDPEGVSAGWLTDTLRSRGVLPRGRVASLTAEPLDVGKGMAGQLARLRLGYEDAGPEAPRSLVAKFSAQDPQARAMQHALGIYEREVGFYEELAPSSPLRTPRCYGSALVVESGQALLLLEDMTGAAGTVNGSWVAGCSVSEAELAVRAIAPLHAAWWMHPRLAEYGWLDLRGPLTVEEAPEAFRGAWKAFLERFGTRVTEEVRQAGDRVAEHLGWIYPRLYRDPPYTLAHNDYSADNLFFGHAGPGPSVVVADWQLVTRGRGILDVAYFLGGSLDSDLRREHERRLLGNYHALLVDGGVRDYPFERCWDDYRLATVAAAWRVIGVVGLGVVPPGQESGFLDVLVPRYCSAIHELVTSELLERERPAPGREPA